MQAKKDRNICLKITWELLLAWAQNESTVWYDCQKGHYDLGQHLVEYKVQNEAADESIVLNIPWTYAVAMCSEHHTCRGGPYLRLTHRRVVGK